MMLHEGRGALKSLEKFAESNWRFFLVRGKASYQSSGAKAFVEQYVGNRVVCEFADFETNPKLEDVVAGCRLFQGSTANAVLAVGGGSVLDMGKLVGLFSAQTSDPESFPGSGEAVYKSAFPIIAVPTTAGTGSEVTNFAVMYVKGNKYSVCDESILPHSAIVDPVLTDKLPQDETANSGLDAVCQAVEALWSTNSTSESERLAKESLSLSLNAINAAASTGDKESRDQMAKAATLAGKAINITKTTAPHALSYALTSDYGVPHGHAVAHFLGPLICFNDSVNEENCNDSRGVGFVREKMKSIFRIFGADSAEEARLSFESIVRNLGLTLNLSSIGVSDDSDVQRLADKVNLERLANNPRRMERAELITMYKERM